MPNVSYWWKAFKFYLTFGYWLLAVNQCLMFTILTTDVEVNGYDLFSVWMNNGMMKKNLAAHNYPSWEDYAADQSSC